MLHTIFLLFSGAALFVVLDSLYITYKVYRSARKTRHLLIPSKVDNTKLCKGPHNWLKAPSVDKGQKTESNICRVCGLVSGKELMASEEYIEAIEEANKRNEITVRMWDSFLAEEDQTIREFMTTELEKGLDFDKLVKIHTAGTTARDRFALYLEAKKEDIQKELTRSN